MKSSCNYHYHINCNQLYIHDEYDYEYEYDIAGRVYWPRCHNDRHLSTKVAQHHQPAVGDDSTRSKFKRKPQSHTTRQKWEDIYTKNRDGKLLKSLIRSEGSNKRLSLLENARNPRKQERNLWVFSDHAIILRLVQLLFCSGALLLVSQRITLVIFHWLSYWFHKIKINWFACVEIIVHPSMITKVHLFYSFPCISW